MIIVDNSVVVKWFFVERESDRAEALARDCVLTGEPAAAPTLLPLEFTNALCQRIRRGFPAENAGPILEAFFESPIQYLPRPEERRRALHRRALALANELGLPATYDAHYIALAEMYGCELWTADERLVNQLAGRLPFVRLLADYPSPPADD